MADSILCSINMAGGAINIYYDTILAQSTLSAGASAASTSIPSGWKVVIILSAIYGYNQVNQVLLAPYPIFTETSSYLYMISYYSSSSNNTSHFDTYDFAYVNSNRLYVNNRCTCSYIVAG